MAYKKGKNTVIIEKNVGIASSAAVGSTKEGEGPLGKDFDIIGESRFGMETWEKAESRMQELCRDVVLKKASLSTDCIDYLFAGDLLNQCIASGFAARSGNIPFIGLYGACSTFAEGLGLSAVFCDAFAENCLAEASSHFCSAERQYRFPLEYGGQRPPTAQWTATAAGSALVSKNPKLAKIKAVSFGRVQDLGITDQNSMGAAMAPAACCTVAGFFRDTGFSFSDFDGVFTGDLGFMGAEIFKELMRAEGFEPGKNYNDCGLMLYERERQQVECGASGCGCSAGVACCHLFPKIAKGELKNILLVSTGALLSPTSVLQKESIPGVAHLVWLSSLD